MEACIASTGCEGGGGQRNILAAGKGRDQLYSPGLLEVNGNPATALPASAKEKRGGGTRRKRTARRRWAPVGAALVARKMAAAPRVFLPVCLLAKDGKERDEQCAGILTRFQFAL